MGDTRRERKPPRAPMQRVGDGIYAAGEENSTPSRWARLIESLKTLAGFALALTGAVTLLALWVGEDTRDDTEEWLCTKIPALVYPDRCDATFAINDYLTADPDTAPKKTSDDLSLVGIETGTTIEDISAMFPPSAPHKVENGRNIDGEGITTRVETWTWRGITVAATIDNRSQSAVNAHVQRDNSKEGGAAYASLPRDLLLGTATVADTIEAFEGHLKGYENNLDGWYYEMALSYLGEESPDAIIIADRPYPGEDDYDRQDVNPDRPLLLGSLACTRTVRRFQMLAEENYGGLQPPPENDTCSADLFGARTYG